LVVGDIVSDIGLVATILDFQPAAGVEVVITSVNTAGTTQGLSLFDGVNGTIDTSLRADSADMGHLKFFVNNTNFARLAAVAGNRTGFTGMQVG